MGKLRLLVLLLFFSLVSCSRQQRAIPTNPDGIPVNMDNLQAMPTYEPSSEALAAGHRSGREHSHAAGKEPLLLTRFKSLEELTKQVQIEYFADTPASVRAPRRKPWVRLTHRSGSREVTSILKSGVSEFDFIQARDGNFWDRVKLVLKSPYAVMNRGDLLRIEILGRRRPNMFGEGDVAFYDLAETMVYNISDEDLMFMPSEDLSEKGYLNTFNHITAQALMTSIFSERTADFIADVHERFYTPELISGNFTDDQLTDRENGAVDNYLDIVNNEWGQELGKQLRKKYHINRKTYWTPELLTNYLNDIQSYHSWAFQVAFEPFRTTDEIVIRYSEKINRVVKEGYALKRYYY